MKSTVEYYSLSLSNLDQSGSIKTEQDTSPWKPEGLVVCALKCWLDCKAMQNWCDLADWCWDWISGCFALYSSLPFPCYHFFLALSLIIFFFVPSFSSLLSFCLHISCMYGSFYLCHLSCVPPFFPFTLPPLFFFSVSIFPLFITYLWLWMSLPCPHPQPPRRSPPDWFLAQSPCSFPPEDVAVDNNTRFLLDVESRGGVKDKQGQQNSDRL